MLSVAGNAQQYWKLRGVAQQCWKLMRCGWKPIRGVAQKYSKLMRCMWLDLMRGVAEQC